MGKRKIAQLQPDDFPGVDTVAFARWRASAAKYEPLAWSVYIGILIVAPLVFILWRPFPGIPVLLKVPAFAVILFAILLGSILLITREPRTLAKRAGITPEAVKEAQKRPGPLTTTEDAANETAIVQAATPNVGPSGASTRAQASPRSPASGSPYGTRLNG